MACNFLGAQCASFGPARRERGLWRGFPQSNATARRFGSFLKLATTQRFCAIRLREAARRSFFRSTASPQRRDLPHRRKTAAAPHNRSARPLRLLCCLVQNCFNCPCDQRRNGTNQRQTLKSRRRVRPCGAAPRGDKPPKPPRGPRRKVAPDPRVPMAAPAAGFNEIPTSQSAQLLDRTGVKRRATCARHEALGAAPSER